MKVVKQAASNPTNRFAARLRSALGLLEAAESYETQEGRRSCRRAALRYLEDAVIMREGGHPVGAALPRAA